MIDPVGVGREWGRTFPDIWLPDSDIEERVIADFWERSKHAIDRPTWPWRRTLRITWYATLIAMLGFIIYGQFIDSYLSGGGSLASAASSDLNIVGWSLGTLVLLLVIVGSLRLMLFTFSGIPAIKQARTTWTNHASEAAVTMIGTRRKLLPRRHPAPSPQPFGITPAAAPALVREWMRHLGERDAEILDFSRTGVHIGGTNFVARVWYQSAAVAASEMKDLAAAAFMHHRTPLAFTTGTYAPEAQRLANGRIALFAYSAEQGTVTAINGVAQNLLTTSSP